MPYRDKEERREYMRRYFQRHKEEFQKKRKEKQKEYRKNHPEEFKEYYRRYYEKHKEYYIRYYAEHGARPKKTRFRVLQRDKFTCQYCGRKAPEVILEIDHIIPRAKGGENRIENLTVACRDCNAGKGDCLLT